MIKNTKISRTKKEIKTKKTTKKKIFISDFSKRVLEFHFEHCSSVKAIHNLLVFVVFEQQSWKLVFNDVLSCSSKAIALPLTDRDIHHPCLYCIPSQSLVIVLENFFLVGYALDGVQLFDFSQQTIQPTYNIAASEPIFYQGTERKSILLSSNFQVKNGKWTLRHETRLELQHSPNWGQWFVVNSLEDKFGIFYWQAPNCLVWCSTEESRSAIFKAKTGIPEDILFFPPKSGIIIARCNQFETYVFEEKKRTNTNKAPWKFCARWKLDITMGLWYQIFIWKNYVGIRYCSQNEKIKIYFLNALDLFSKLK